MRKRSLNRAASGLSLLIVTGTIAWVAGDTIARSGPKRESWQPTRLQSRVETHAALSADLFDRSGAVIARPRWIRDERGRVRAVVDRPLGRPMAAAGVGRSMVVPVGVQGGLSDVVRSEYEGVRPFEHPSPIIRAFVGDPVLTAPEMPAVTVTLDGELSERIFHLLPSAGRGSSAVVMAATTGELYAVVDSPGADVSRDAVPTGPQSLWAFLSANLPASTLKTMTAAWILMRRPQDAAIACECVGDRCWTRHGRVSGLEDAVVRSCDTWFRNESRRIEPESWMQFLLAAGIAPVGIAGLPDSRLLLANRKPGVMQWPHAIGQQVWVSLVGLATAYATVTSTSGRLRPPSIIAKLGDQPVGIAEGPEVVPPPVARRIRSILRTTATNGTAIAVNRTFSGHSASGKTGTGEVEGATSDAVFVALAPWDQPQWIVVVSVRGGGAGSSAGRIAGQILNLLPFGREKGAARGGRQQ